MTLDQLLAPYKAVENLAPLVSLIDDLPAMRVLALWPFLPKEWAAPDKRPPEDTNARWRWLWEGCFYDEQQFADMVEMTTRDLGRKLTRLASARLIFPDGSVQEKAEAFVRSRIKQEM